MTTTRNEVGQKVKGSKLSAAKKVFTKVSSVKYHHLEFYVGNDNTNNNNKKKKNAPERCTFQLCLIFT